MSNNILSVVRNKNVSTSDLMKVVAGNVRAMRLRRNISQKDFASKVGIALPTYRRFETTGEISLRKLVEIAKFFDVAGDFKSLFTKREYDPNSLGQPTVKRTKQKISVNSALKKKSASATTFGLPSALHFSGKIGYGSA